MPEFERVHLVWLTGLSCDGCTIKALGDTTAGGLEALLRGDVAGLPRIELIHPILSLESGEAFVNRLRAAERGELEPFGLVNEAALPQGDSAGAGFYSSLGEEDGKPIRFQEWVTRLAPRAAFVVAWGDCAVWGGPHSLAPNPVASTGTSMFLGPAYRGTTGLPVVNLPGCAPPTILLQVLVSVLRWMRGDGPSLELDETNRPSRLYPEIWKGAFVSWQA
jgi:hydrogenase small subunit